MSDILSKLQSQSQDFQNIANRGQQLINDFDTDRLIEQGTDYAYKMGKEQLSALVGGETVAAIHQGAPLIYKTGKTVWNAYNRPDETAQAFKDKITGKITKELGEAGRKAQKVVNENLSGGSNPYLDESRNFRYNVNEGTIETEGGGSVNFGLDREAEFRTPLEQREFESPRLPRRPVGRVPEREEFTDEQTSFRFRAPTETELQQRFQAEQDIIDRLPDVPETTPGPSIGLQRVPGEFIPPEGQVGSSYVRPGTQLEIKPDAKAPNVDYRPQPSTEAETEPVARTQDLRADLSATKETNESSDTRLLNINEKYDKLLREQSLKDPIGAQSQFVRREEPAGLDLEDIQPIRIRTEPTPLGQETSLPKLPPVPEQPARVPASQEPRLPTITEETEPDTEPFITRPPPVPSLDDLQARLNRLQEADTQATKISTAEAEAKPIAQPKPSVQPETDEFGLPKLTEEIGETEAKVAPEEEIADAIPGVGEIIGGILGIGAAVAGAVEASKVEKPPTQPAGMPMMQTAFDSAPVIDSSDYHQL